MENIILGRSTKLTVTFYTFDPNTDIGSPVDPVTVVGTVTDSDNIVVTTFTPAREGLGVYGYTWVPAGVGTFNVVFTGTYVGGNSDVVSEEFSVTEKAQNIPFAIKLGDDQTLQFMPLLDSIFIDPEEVLSVFPDAPLMDVVEFIRVYSKEVQEILSRQPDPNSNGVHSTDPTTWHTIEFEYIRAATLCSLSKLYGFGDADLTQITLGDLQVTNQRFGRTSINRANAVTWCEIAGALRMELIADSGKAGIRAIKKGSHFTNPIPHRWLKQYEHGRF